MDNATVNAAWNAIDADIKAEKPKRLIYGLSVTIEQRISDDLNDPDYPTLGGATDPRVLRRLEREVGDLLNRLRTYGMRVTNVEVITTEEVSHV